MDKEIIRRWEANKEHLKNYIKSLSYEDECFIMGSKHYDTIETRIRLDIYNAYDDKGNKIEGEYITLTNKEYDNIDVK